MKGYCRQCSMVIDETEQIKGYCNDCWKDILVYPIKFSELDEMTKDRLMTAICERILKLESSIKMNGKHVAMREAYVDASNTLEEVRLRLEKVQSDFNTLKTMLNDMKALFQKGWGVPK